MIDIKIENVTEDDAAELLEIYSYYVKNTAISFECTLPTVEEFRLRIKNTLKKYPYISAKCDGKIVGYAYAGSFIAREAYKFSAELTIYVDKNFRKCGIGKKLYGELQERLKKMGITNFYACIGYPDIEDEYLTLNSVQFHKHLGFTIAGKFTDCGFKFNRRYSMVWMEKIVAH